MTTFLKVKQYKKDFERMRILFISKDKYEQLNKPKTE